MTNLVWIKEGEKYFLKNQETILIDLQLQYGGNAGFLIQDKWFQVTRKGFWTPVYEIIHNTRSYLKLIHSFWGSQGKIIFQDGSSYSLIYKNKNGLKLQFLDGNNEILTYGIAIEGKRPVMEFHIGIAMEDADKLLVLAALGMIIFSCVFKETGSGEELITIIV